MEYQFFTYTRKDGSKVVKAVGSYAGRPISGKSICHPNDIFDENKGKELAAARCDEKITQKRCKRALEKYMASRVALAQALEKHSELSEYLLKTKSEHNQIEAKILEILKNL